MSKCLHDDHLDIHTYYTLFIQFSVYTIDKCMYIHHILHIVSHLDQFRILFALTADTRGSEEGTMSLHQFTSLHPSHCK